MREIKIIFNEPLHHVCLMYGLRQTYGRMPFMNRRVIEAGGKKYSWTMSQLSRL